MDMFITFRGEEDVNIEYHVDDSGPGSGVGVEWEFTDGRPDPLVTEKEEEEICAQIIEHWHDNRDYVPEDF